MAAQYPTIFGSLDLSNRDNSPERNLEPVLGLPVLQLLQFGSKAPEKTLCQVNEPLSYSFRVT